MNKGYVISIKRVVNYLNKPVPKEEQEWQYAQFDCHAGCMSSGYPEFGCELHAVKFESVDKAMEWWKKWGKYLSPESFNNRYKYDYSTLAIRQHISIYKTITKIQGDLEE